MSLKRLGLLVAGAAIVVGAGRLYMGGGIGTASGNTAPIADARGAGTPTTAVSTADQTGRGAAAGGMAHSGAAAGGMAQTSGNTTGIGQTSGSAPNSGASLYDIAAPHSAPIPQHSLRLRIIANSDSAADQSVKLKVRNAVVLQVAQYLKNAKSEQQAQAIVSAHLAQIDALATRVVRANGFQYAVRTNVGKVPFPTKIYGNQVYPAGEYEALRIRLGQAQGQNWWCVLFPPLCFIDIADGDAVPNTAGFPDLPPLETIQVKNASGSMTTVQVRLASVDYGEELWHAVQQWFKNRRPITVG